MEFRSNLILQNGELTNHNFFGSLPGVGELIRDHSRDTDWVSSTDE